MAYDPYNPPTQSMGRRRTLASTLGATPVSNPQAGLGPLSRSLLAGGHPITSAQTPEAQYGVPNRTYGGRGAAGTLAPSATSSASPLANSVFSREAPGPTAIGTPRRQISTLSEMFGGATPGQVAYGGGTRQGFLAPPAPESGVKIRNVNPTLISPGLAGAGPGVVKAEEDKLLARPAVRAGMGPNQYSAYQSRNTPQKLAANKLAYNSRLQAAVANPPQTAYQKRYATRQAEGQTLFERAFAQQNPGAAAQMAGVKAAGQRQTDLLAHNAAEGKAKRAVDEQRNSLAAVVGLVQGGMSLEEAQKAVAAQGGNSKPSRAAIARVPPAAAGHIDPGDFEKAKNLPPDQRDAFIASKVPDAVARKKVTDALDEQRSLDNPTLWDAFGAGAGKALGDWSPLPSLHNFLFGKKPVEPTKRVNRRTGKTEPIPSTDYSQHNF